MIQLAACLTRHLPHLREPRPDGELLAAFLAERDEEAFAELVRRHGPLVWAACRRLLPDAADAEDAFQTSFMVLVRRARRLRSRDTVGPWLYQVAVWTARNIRRRNARILSKRKPLGDTAAHAASPELRHDVDDALAALPEKYRTPLVMCHLQGWSRRDAAERLGCPEGTLSSLLARGLDRLRTKLAGLDPAKALAVAAPAVPMLLANSTVKAAAGMQLAAAGAVNASVHQLVEGVVRMFWIKKATAASFALVAMFGMGIGVGVSVKQMPGASAGDGPAEKIDEAILHAFGVGNDKLVLEAQVMVTTAEENMADAVKSGDADKIAEAREKLDAATKALERAAHEKRAAEMARRFREVRDLAANEDVRKLKFSLVMLEARRAALEGELKAAKEQLAKAGDDARKDAARDLLARLAAALKATEADEAAARTGLERLALDLKKDALKEELLRANRDVEAQIERLMAEEQMLQAQSAMLAQKRAALQKQLEELAKKKPAPEAPPAGAGSLDITIAPATDRVPFSVTEINANGKPVGTMTFDNLTVLSTYLARTGKDATGPKTVRLTVQSETKFEVIKQIVETCAAAGLKPPATLNLSKPKAAADAANADYIRMLDSYYRRLGDATKPQR